MLLYFVKTSIYATAGTSGTQYAIPTGGFVEPEPPPSASPLPGTFFFLSGVTFFALSVSYMHGTRERDPKCEERALVPEKEIIYLFLLLRTMEL
jgi:hypothetical protein